MNSILINGKKAEIDCKPGQVSDGYHTFDELYEHRCLLFVALMLAHSDLAWKSRKNAEGQEWEGWFIAGIVLPTGQISYHLPVELWEVCAVAERERALFDGHTSADVVARLKKWLAQ